MNNNVRNRIAALILALVLSFAMTVSAGAADSAACLTVTAAFEGGATVVTVELDGAQGVTNGRLAITYDPALVTLTGVQVMESCGATSLNRETPGNVTLAWVGSVLQEETIMARLSFQPVPGTNKDQLFRVQCLEAYAGEETVEVASGQAAVVFNPFADIDGHWAEREILTAYHAGLFKGMTSGTFAPEGKLTRAMFVTTLYRMAGAPAEAGKQTFTDVPAGSYYEKAVAWAVEQGITKGVGGSRFAPDKTIDRQEIATMLYRYSAAAGKDVSAGGKLEDFRDGGSVSSWAVDAMAWAIGSNLLQGYPGGYLMPRATGTRAQAAVILCRYLGL